MTHAAAEPADSLPARPSPRRPKLTARRLLPAVAAALVLAAASFFAIKALTGGDDDELKVDDPAGTELTLPKPDGWKELSSDERDRLPGNPVAVLRREDRKGLVVLNAQQAPAGDLRKLSSQLDGRLRKRFSDFRKVSSRRLRVKAGKALLYSYARRRKGTAQTLLVVPAGARSYTVNAVVPAGAEGAAREVGQILLGFDHG